ncbi:hypothetical protein CYMTET_54986 [Cymbomonas tetramitiformis]|uniref:Uncharacterized protein n=1 Tax=Cymbomonas tetramitiformis TaxID=36881 RepID=A0AAE0BDU0_9CHLO|nr:hypothetical protein CYMTET_54986 [Cymbomonas tetramitiformis]
MDIASESKGTRTSLRSLLRRRDGAPPAGGGPLLRAEHDRLTKVAKTINAASGNVTSRWRVTKLPTWPASIGAMRMPGELLGPDEQLTENQTSHGSAVPENMSFDLEEVPDLLKASADGFSDEEGPDDAETARLLGQLRLESDATEYNENIFVQAFHAHGCDQAWPTDYDMWDERTATEAGLMDELLRTAEEGQDVDMPEEENVVDMPPPENLQWDIRPGEPLFSDNPDNDITVGEAVYYFMQLRMDQGWSRPAFDRFLKVLLMLLDPRKWDPMEECGVVLEKDEAGIVVKRCKERRFEVVKTADGEKLRPKEWFYYFPIEDTIRRWMECPEFCKARARRDARLQCDFWTSELARTINRHASVKGALLQDAPRIETPVGGDPYVEYAEHHVMVISPGADDCQVFNSDVGSYSMGVGVVKSEDLHYSMRHRDKFHKYLWMTKGPRQKIVNPLVVWGLFEDEMLSLSKGQTVDGAAFVVHDAFLKKSYQLTVILGMVYADSVMRITMGRFMGISSYRADPYSLFEGTVGPGGRGMYFRGYFKEVEQQGWTNSKGSKKVWADDADAMITKQMHASMVASTESGAEPAHATGRHGRGALERIPYFDPMHAYAHPFAHCVLYGNAKRCLKLWFGKLSNNTHPRLVLPKAIVDEIQSRAALIQPPHDIGRPYHCVVKYLADSPLTETEVRRAREVAKEHLWEHAAIMEDKGPAKMLTFNMRLAVVHLFRQEYYLGDVGAAMEFWVERGIQRAKGIVKDSHVKNKPVEAIMNGTCEKLALEAYVSLHPTMRSLPELANELYPGQAAVSVGLVDPAAEAKTSPCYFMGTGRRVAHDAPVLASCLAQLQHLVGMLHPRQQGAQALCTCDIIVYLRMSLNLEEFTSSLYTRAEKRVSYHVSISDTGFGNLLPTGLDSLSEFPYAKVLAYYLVIDTESQHTVCRLASLRAYRQVEDEYMENQGITVLARNDYVELLLPCALIGTKALFVETKSKDTGDNLYHAVHLLREIQGIH